MWGRSSAVGDPVVSKVIGCPVGVWEALAAAQALAREYPTPAYAGPLPARASHSTWLALMVAFSDIRQSSVPS